MCEKHYRQWWRATNYSHNKSYEQQYYLKTLKLVRQSKNKSKQKECLRCKTVFHKTGMNQKFCSKTCQNNINHKNKRLKPEFKLIHNLRSRVRKALKGSTRDKGIFKLLGCDNIFLRVYLESKFQPGMTWTNYGQWHIDHIKPLSSFDLSKKDELKQACNYSNLQPLWAKDNLSKGSKL